LEEDLAVALAGDAWVEEDQNAPVFKGADEAAKALLESEDGFGDLVVEEGTAAGLFDGFMRAWTTGSEGTAKGRRSMMTQLRASPWTSTPCQKLAVPKRTEFGVERNSSRRALRGAVPWRSIGKSRTGRRRS